MKHVIFFLALLVPVAALATDYKCVKGNCSDGWGRRTYGDSEYYEGNFVNGQFEGKGTFENNEIRYTGMWKDGWQSGEGRLIRKQQSGPGRGLPEEEMAGTFALGKLSGQGTYITYNVSAGKAPDTAMMWKGNFADGALTGSGIMLIHGITTYYSDSWTGNFTFNTGYELRAKTGERRDGSMTGTGLFISNTELQSTAAKAAPATAAPASAAPAAGGSMLDYGIFNTHQKKLDASYAPKESSTGTGGTAGGARCSCCSGKGTIVSQSFNHAMGSGVNYMKYENVTCNCCHGTGRAADQTEWKARTDGGANLDYKH